MRLVLLKIAGILLVIWCAALIVFAAIIGFARIASAQPNQGFGPTFDPTNLALRVNVVAGSSGGLSPSNFGSAFPVQGAAVGGKDPNGAFASMTISSTGRLQVTCDNCSSSAATFGTAFPSSGGATGFKDALGAFASVSLTNGLPVNVVAGGTTNSTFGVTFPTTGIAGGYKDANGAFASVTGSNGGLNVNVLSGGGGSATYGTAFPSTGAVGFKDALGSYASVTLTAGLPVNIVQGAATDSLYNATMPISGFGIGALNPAGRFASLTVDNSGNLNIVGVVAVSNSVLPTGASTSADVQNVEAAIREFSGVWNTAIPIAGVAVGYKDASGLIASVSGSNGGLNVNVLSGGGGSATYGTAFPASGATGFKDALGAYASVTLTNGLPVNIVQGAATDSLYNGDMPATGIPVGFRNAAGKFASASITNNNALLVEVVGGGSAVVAAQGASASTSSAWPIVNVDDAGVMVRAGDATNKALRVNIVAGSAAGGTSSSFGTAFPSAGTAAGFKDGLGAMASATVNNSGAQNVNVISGSTLIATANQGSSNTVANAWPFVTVSDGGIMVRPGDDTNKAVRVNVVAGGTTNSTFGTVFPTTGIAAGYKDSLGAFASFTGANGKQNVIVGNESTLIATVTGTVTIGTTNGTFGSAFPTTGLAPGYRDSLGSFASFSGANGRLNVIVGNDSTLIATVTGTVTANQGASAVAANGWPIVNVDDAGIMVRAGDATNKALRVNVVAGGTSNSSFGVAFPSTGIAGGYKDANGAFASLTGANGAIGTVRYDSAGREVGAALPGKQSVPVVVQQAPQLPTGQVSLGAKQTTIVNVPAGQAPATPLKGVTPGGGQASFGWVQPWVRCDQTASISVSNSGMTQVVGAVNGKSIYVCGYTVVASTTPVGVGFSYGTGSNCGTLSGDITGSMTVAASGGMVNANSPIPYFETPAGQALCVKLSNGAQVGGHLRYTFF